MAGETRADPGSRAPRQSGLTSPAALAPGSRTAARPAPPARGLLGREGLRVRPHSGARGAPIAFALAAVFFSTSAIAFFASIPLNAARPSLPLLPLRV